MKIEQITASEPVLAKDSAAFSRYWIMFFRNITDNFNSIPVGITQDVAVKTPSNTTAVLHFTNGILTSVT